MNLYLKRRAKPDPAEQRKAQEEVRRQIALAVSIAENKAEAKAQADVLAALQQITGN